MATRVGERSYIKWKKWIPRLQSVGEIRFGTDVFPLGQTSAFLLYGIPRNVRTITKTISGHRTVWKQGDRKRMKPETTKEDKLKKLREAAAEAGEMEEGREEGSDLYRMYSPDTPEGKNFYESLTDAQLLGILRDRAKELDHSPSQKEMFWVYREYLRKRFRRWPYALEAAGLKRTCGSGGKSWKQMEQEQEHYQSLLKKLRAEAEKLCRIPHPSDVPGLCEELGHYEKNWSTVIQNAGLDAEFFRKHALYRIEDLDETSKAYLDEICEKARQYGRAPKKSEVSKEVQTVLVRSCRSWRNALYQIGLEPVERIHPFSSTFIDCRKVPDSRQHSRALHDCCYRLVNPPEETVRDLGELKEICQSLGRIPEKKEVRKELRTRLTKVCGSWTNVLYQLKAEETEISTGGGCRKVRNQMSEKENYRNEENSDVKDTDSSHSCSGHDRRTGGMPEKRRQ